jgi:hypothetical protein
VAHQGISLFTSTIRRPPPDTIPQQLNSHSKLHEVLALIQAYKAGADEALVLDPTGAVATCNATNFFIVRKGEVWTSTGDYCMNGITRAKVIELCRQGTALQLQSQSFHDSFFRFGVTPEGIKFFYRSVLADVPSCPPLYVHLSNFYGNAVMTAVAALAAGATAPDVCMNGVGHHCGHISLAEVAMVLEALYDVRTGLRLEKLRETSRLVQKLSGISLPLPSPVAGDFAFMTDGAYWAAEAHLPYEERIHAKFPIPPGMVGNREEVVWSDGTMTPESIKAKLTVMGFGEREINDLVVDRIIAKLGAELRLSRSYPNWMPDADFDRLCRRIVADMSEAETDEQTVLQPAQS